MAPPAPTPYSYVNQDSLVPPPPPLPPVSPAYPGAFGGVTPGGTAVQPPGMPPPPLVAPSPAPPWPGGFPSSPSQPPNSGMKKALLFVLAAVIVAVAIIGGAYLVSHGSSSSPQTSATATPAVTATPATGPNGSPSDSASFTVQERSPYQEVLTVTHGAVCGSFDDGKKHQVGRGTQSDGSTYVETMIARCDPQHSVYRQGTLTYVELAGYFEVDFFTASGQPADVCATSTNTTPFVVQQLQGNLSSSSAASGPFQAPQSPDLTCASGQTIFLKAANGSWQGVVSR